jgi:hypothetical protein
MPQFFIDGGTRYVNRWRQDLKEITRLLLAAGAQVGGGGRKHKLEELIYRLECKDSGTSPLMLSIRHYGKHYHHVLELR